MHHFSDLIFFLYIKIKQPLLQRAVQISGYLLRVHAYERARSGAGALIFK